MLNYSKLLKMAKDARDNMLAPYRVKETRKKGELKIAELESKLAEEDQKIQEIAANYPLDFDKLANALDERDLVERRIEQLEKIIETLFSEEDEEAAAEQDTKKDKKKDK